MGELRAGAWKPTRVWNAGLKAATINGNARGTVLRVMATVAARRLYDIVMVQEHHMANHDQIKAAAEQLRTWGYSSTWTPAVAKTEGTTGGTAVL